jgi:hypothetical protein
MLPGMAGKRIVDEAFCGVESKRHACRSTNTASAVARVLCQNPFTRFLQR